MAAAPDHSELRTLLDAVCEAIATQTQLDRLAEIVLADDAARDEYLRYMAFHAELSARFGSGTLDWQQAEDAPSSEAELVAVVNRRCPWEAAYDFVSNYWALSLLVSGLAMTILLLSMAHIVPDWKRFVPGRQLETPSVEFVAQITQLEQAKWDESSDGNYKNRDLFDDDRLILQAGLAVITYDTGARVVLEGPATYQIRGANTGSLQVGKLVAQVETEAAQGFAVEIPGAQVVDLGTEFGVDVDEHGAAEVAVLKGVVDVVGDSDKAGLHTRLRLTAGEGASVASGSGTITHKPEVVAQFATSMMSRLQGLAAPPAAVANDSETATMVVKGPDNRSYIVINALPWDAGNSAEYSQVGFTTGKRPGSEPSNWMGDSGWGWPQDAPSATYHFSGLADGVYDVYVSWRQVVAKPLGTATYSGTDGFATLALDQSPGNIGHADSRGTVKLSSSRENTIDFVFLGQVAVADGAFDLTVRGSDGSDGLLVDAAAVSRSTATKPRSGVPPRREPAADQSNNTDSERAGNGE